MDQRARLRLVTLLALLPIGPLASAQGAGEPLPDYLHDRGTGIQTSFSRHVRRRGRAARVSLLRIRR